LNGNAAGSVSGDEATKARRATAALEKPRGGTAHNRRRLNMGQLTAKPAERSEILREMIVSDAGCLRHEIELMAAGVPGHADNIVDFARRIVDLSAELDKVESKPEYRRREAGWRSAFYDTAYDKDQTERMALFDKVVEFLLSIGCKPTWTAGHDGSDRDDNYGVIIASVTYKGEKFERNPCYQVEYELPADLIQKLDENLPFRTAPQ
jgi:hypothetical protein